jgi:hypothetical protein
VMTRFRHRFEGECRFVVVRIDEFGKSRIRYWVLVLGRGHGVDQPSRSMTAGLGPLLSISMIGVLEVVVEKVGHDE